ncbi:Protein FAM221A/B [Trypanosoma melophagium]|uniref:Protein FAM221A/B n=1 Tax=Trypanosoma melophagium TaxID=715481 RepID=UPI00351A9F3C|nr:Protein FAM221A/B [Trypanosoma melophagium]
MKRSSIQSQDSNVASSVGVGGNALVRRGKQILRPIVPSSGELVPGQQGNPQYGMVIESNDVHSEIRDLSSRVKGVIEKYLQKNATSEEQVLQGIRRFGPSAQSKKILNKENDAAILAFKTGVYAVWRCERPKLSGSNTDFCTRIGYQHRCFCGHTLEQHATPKPTRGRVPAPKCQSCKCAGFNYIPNEPEEIGEAWLTRRRDWDPSQWSAKCRCGHGNKQHDPQTHSCSVCSCCAYTSHFLCVVCDCDGEAHTTVLELERERLEKGRPVREAYFPLGGLEWSVRELVLDDPSGAGALTAPPSIPAIKTGGKSTPAAVVVSSYSNGGAGKRNDSLVPGSVLPVLGLGTDHLAQIPQYCTSCATIFRSPKSKFCSKCGKPRE